MSKTYRHTLPLIVSILIVMMLVLLMIDAETELTDLVATVTAIVGALAIYFQMKRSKDMEEGSFIVSLNDSFLNSDGIKQVYRKLVSRQPLTVEDQVDVVEYLTFFETIYILYKRDLVDMAVLDDLFSYRFFLAVNDRDIQEMELIQDAPYYKNIYALDRVWREFRQRHRKDPPVNDENRLSSRVADYAALSKEA